MVLARCKVTSALHCEGAMTLEEWKSMELSHEPVPQRDGEQEFVLRSRKATLLSIPRHRAEY